MGRRARVLSLVLLSAWAGGCGSSSDDSAGLGDSFNPWVQGGQTGALDCGPTPAAAMGEAIPAGEGGIVLRVSGCELGFDPTGIALTDAMGEPVEFDVERLDDDNLLIVPEMGLDEGVYNIEDMANGTEPTPVAVRREAALPMRLGTLAQIEGGCGDQVFLLNLDPLVLEYLPNLKLSVSVDDGPTETFFDFGTLTVMDGEAMIALPECLSTCIGAGTHQLVLTAEIAGELGTLEPVELEFQVGCDDDGAGCRAGGEGGGRMWPAALSVAALIAWRRRRRRRPG
ncbi:MAG: MYXO-CTERM sorting domain-containing protein [Myxococcales bacterium]|jgi:MYXO-CTERM domain-containing protein